LVIEEDCGTNDGIEFYVTDKNILDRTSAFDIEGIVEAAQLITPDIQQKLKKARTDTIIVRSPLTCETSKGVCQKCYGLMPGGDFAPIGTNVGVLDGQAISERSTQLTMRTFHTGGAVDAGGGALAGFKRLEQIFKVPETVPNKATLAQVDGQIDSIKESPIGGKDILIDGITHYVPINLEPTVKRHQSVTKGEKLSTGVIKPQELAELKNFKYAQREMVKELDDIYENKFFQKTFETAIRGVTDNAEIINPGDTDFLPGDKVAASYIKKKNKALVGDGKEPAQFNEYFKSIEMLTDDGQDWLDRLSNVHLKSTIKDMASTRMASNIHGHNPLPAYMYGIEFAADPKFTY
jgi:DNA-directed RNA polymerase subunit beta'